MNKLTAYCLALLFITSCSKDSEVLSPSESVLTKSELNDLILEQMGERQLFHWQEQTDMTILSAALLSDSILAIGYTVNGQKDLSSSIHTIDTRAEDWTAERERLLELVLSAEQKSRGNDALTLADIQPAHMVDDWPTLFVQITDVRTITQLRADANVRYIEPTGYWLEEETNRSTSGCSGAPSSYINPSDYETFSPNTKVPWNYFSHNIPAAWQESTGDGETITIIDSGASQSQDNLGSSFSSGNSGGRSISKYSTHWSGSWWWASLDSPHDQCGHGTSMAGLAAGPQSTDGNASGVAYRSDLISVRAVQDVIITSSNEKRGVRDALKIAANSDSRIASMSLGTPFYSSTVADGVYYAYNSGVMVMSAAGTSISFLSWYGVIFPATMSQTVAVTGVKDGEELEACEACHDGSAVDFVIVMERASNDERHSLSLATYGNQPSYIGGSSCATATMAGVTAMVWSAHPNWGRNTVMQRLKQSSEFYPNPHGAFGYGRIDALQAVE